MKKSGLRILLASAIAGAAAIGLASTALAGPPPVVDGSGGTPFLCPAVGGPQGNHFGSALPGGQGTFLPGHNQAGAHVNSNGTNTEGPGQSPGPGNVVDGKGNSDWSPIWPAP